jgi:uncharacterized protein (TIGR00255 family)
MTGFGIAEGPVAGGRLQAEIRTVNHRHFNAQLRLPSALQGLDGVLRERLRSRIERGHVALTARWVEAPPAVQGEIRVDVERARDILAAIERLRRALALPGEVDLAFLARQPDVLRFEGSVDEPPQVDPAEVLAVVDAALEGVAAMRAQEGTALVRELTLRLDLVAAALGRIRERAPERVTAERARLRQAVTELMEGREPDPDRLAQEIALLADRLDITEEMVRLEAHLAAAREILAADAPGGRRLGFLAQEFLREINTIGSKANDAVIIGEVVSMKEELERFREQLENIE